MTTRKHSVKVYRLFLGSSLTAALLFCQLMPADAAPRGWSGHGSRHYHGGYRGGWGGGDALGLFAAVLVTGALLASIPDSREAAGYGTSPGRDSDYGWREDSSGWGAVPRAIVDKAAAEAAERGAAVKFVRTTDQSGSEEVLATPQNREGGYQLVDVKYIRNGQVMEETIKRIPVS